MSLIIVLSTKTNKLLSLKYYQIYEPTQVRLGSLQPWRSNRGGDEVMIGNKDFYPSIAL